MESELKTKPLRDIGHEIGLCYRARTWLPELSAHRTPSSAVVLENGVALPGPSNAFHEDIRKFGSGRYCFWYHLILFSTPDNSDPRTNGRTYTIAYAPVPRSIFVLIIPPLLRYFAYRGIDLVVRIGRRIKPIRGVARWIIQGTNSLLQFARVWTGRAIRFIRRIKPVPIFWGFLYWICFGLVLVRGQFRRAYVKGKR